MIGWLFRRLDLWRVERTITKTRIGLTQLLVHHDRVLEALFMGSKDVRLPALLVALERRARQFVIILNALQAKAQAIRHPTETNLNSYERAAQEVDKASPEMEAELRLIEQAELNYAAQKVREWQEVDDGTLDDIVASCVVKHHEIQ